MIVCVHEPDVIIIFLGAVCERAQSIDVAVGNTFADDVVPISVGINV